MSDTPQLTPPPEKTARRNAGVAILAWIAIIIALISTAITIFVWFQAESAVNIAHKASTTITQLDTNYQTLSAQMNTAKGYHLQFNNQLKSMQAELNEMKHNQANGVAKQTTQPDQDKTTNTDSIPNQTRESDKTNQPTPKHQQALQSLGNKQGQLQQNMSSALANLDKVQQQVAQQKSVLQQQSDTIAKQQHQLNQQSQAQQQQKLSLSDARLQIRELLRRGSSSQRQWIIGEAEYLTRLAQLQLSINHNPSAALRLLKSADQDLASLHDSRLQPARMSLNQDIQKLAAITPIDIGKLIKQLNDVSEKVANLPLAPRTQFAPEQSTAGSSEETTDAKSKGSGKTKPKANPTAQPPVTGYEAAIAGLKKLVIIKKITSNPDMVTSMDQINYSKENIRLKISQAEWAVLHKNQELYQQNISLAQTLLNDLPATTAQKARILNISNELQELKQKRIYADTPDLNNSIAAIRSLLVNHQSESDAYIKTPAASETSNNPAITNSQPAPTSNDSQATNYTSDNQAAPTPMNDSTNQPEHRHSPRKENLSLNSQHQTTPPTRPNNPSSTEHGGTHRGADKTHKPSAQRQALKNKTATSSRHVLPPHNLHNYSEDAFV